MTLAEVLTAEIERRGIPIQTLSTTAGIPNTSMYDIVKGRTPNPGLLTVLAILRALDKSLTWLDRQMRTGADAPSDA